MDNLTKAQRRALRALAETAYRRELGRALKSLENEFGRWRSGDIDEFALSQLIHEFHDGISRDLWKSYTLGSLHSAVASAIAASILRRAEVDSKLLTILERAIEMYATERDEPEPAE
jgi:hypothetical protein